VKTFIFTFSPFLVLSTLLGHSPAHAQKLQQLRVALSTPTPHMAPLYVAKDKKTLREIWARCPDDFGQQRVASRADVRRRGTADNRQRAGVAG
jgi:hypothetical protein